MSVFSRIILKRHIPGALFLFILLILFAAGRVAAEEYAVPNQGSPYGNFANIQADQILHLPTGLLVTAEQMMDTVENSRVIYIGETHDNLEAHRIQLEIIKRLLDRSPGRVAVGMEMFRKSAQEELDLWHNGQLSDAKFKKLFRKNWGEGYKLYQPIFDFIKEKRLPLIGLKSSKETEARLKKGYTQVNFPEMDLNDKYHKAYAEAIFGGGKNKHGHGGNILYKMLTLWDESMAETVADFLKNPERKDWTLVVLAGGFHVQYGYGIPKRAFRRIPHAYSIILPMGVEIPEELKDREMDIEPVSIPLYAADFGWKIGYKTLPKNRIRLGVRVEEINNSGLRVISVAAGSAADLMNVLKDDILVSLDGEKISDIDDLINLLQKKSFGDPVVLTVFRDNGQTLLRGTIQKPKSN